MSFQAGIGFWQLLAEGFSEVTPVYLLQAGLFFFLLLPFSHVFSDSQPPTQRSTGTARDDFVIRWCFLDDPSFPCNLIPSRGWCQASGTFGNGLHCTHLREACSKWPKSLKVSKQSTVFSSGPQNMTYWSARALLGESSCSVLSSPAPFSSNPKLLCTSRVMILRVRGAHVPNDPQCLYCPDAFSVVAFSYICVLSAWDFSITHRTKSTTLGPACETPLKSLYRLPLVSDVWKSTFLTVLCFRFLFMRMTTNHRISQDYVRTSYTLFWAPLKMEGIKKGISKILCIFCHWPVRAPISSMCFAALRSINTASLFLFQHYLDSVSLCYSNSLPELPNGESH